MAVQEKNHDAVKLAVLPRVSVASILAEDLRIIREEDPPMPLPDEVELRLLIDFFLLLQRWDDILQSKRTAAGALLPAQGDIAA
jgi:hypothetical protein